MTEEKEGLPVLLFASRGEWGRWLDEHHASTEGVWLQFAKKGSGVTTVTYDEAVEMALCYGWIDSQAARLDDRYWLQRYTPRRKRSKWSRINREKAEKLIAGGLMQPAGLLEVERAMADGRWDAAYDGPKNMAVPQDLLQALKQNEQARAFFDSLNSRNRYAILYQIEDAKKPETRARRIEKYVKMLSNQEKLY
jgi:uncharacterized protein YdeI (YjbR/CyaY-like superfamily)